MSDRHAIVNPVKGKNPPKTGDLAILAATESDLRCLGRLARTPVVEHRKLLMSALTVHAGDHHRYTIVGPLIGAPYAAMVVECLQVWGVTRLVFIGWCGAVSPQVKAGDIIVPTAAVVDEGTSGNYGTPAGRTARPAPALAGQVRLALQRCDASYHHGAVWTTDAIFRETVAKVKHFQAQGTLAVEMEMSAIFAVAAFRSVQAAGLLVVSDELSDYHWRPGFTLPAFRSARDTACRAVLDMAEESAF
jgi:uridine phosphorylase